MNYTLKSKPKKNQWQTQTPTSSFESRMASCLANIFKLRNILIFFFGVICFVQVRQSIDKFLSGNKSTFVFERVQSSTKLPIITACQDGFKDYTTMKTMMNPGWGGFVVKWYTFTSFTYFLFNTFNSFRPKIVKLKIF